MGGRRAVSQSSLIESGTSSSGRGRGCLSCARGLILSVLVFAAFFLNFSRADPAETSKCFDTLLTPPNLAFAIWLPIYILEFCFVCYQLFARRPRRSKLIRKIGLLWIIHQVLTAIWMQIFARKYIYYATAIITAMLALALLIFAITTTEFRSNKYPHYNFLDYLFIEVPFALLLGWEFLATLISFSHTATALTSAGILPVDQQVSILLACAFVSFMLIVVAAVLFAGLPMLMDPFVHLPLIWGTSLLGVRWYLGTGSTAPHLEWATRPIRLGVAYAAWSAAVIVGIFFIVAAAILWRSRLCCAQPYPLSDTSEGSSESSDPGTHRSPRTARSALTGERV